MIFRFVKIVVTFIRSILLYKFNNKENSPELFTVAFVYLKIVTGIPLEVKVIFNLI